MSLVHKFDYSDIIARYNKMATKNVWEGGRDFN